MIISVKEEHLRRVHPLRPFPCPVERAIKSATGIKCDVGYGFIEILGTNRLIRTPRSVQRFIRNWDQSRPVRPFNFIFKGA